MIERLKKLFKIQFLAIIAPFILMGPTILSGKAIYWGTPLLQFVPWWTQAWQTLKLGQLPLWNPLVGMGVPLLANYQSALLYPPTWLYFLFAEIADSPGIAWGQALLIALHLAWAAWGMVSLTKKMGWTALAQTVSALAFSLSGFLVARSHFLSIISAAAWLPWLLFAAYQLVHLDNKKRPFLLLTLFVTMQLLAGHAQTTWYSLILTFAFLTFWTWQKSSNTEILKNWSKFAFMGIWAAILAAAQLLPTSEYLLQSQRASEFNIAQAMTYSFWPWRFLTVFLPNLFGTPANGDYWGYAAFWEDATYIGLISIILAIAFIFYKNRNSAQKKFATFLIILIGISFLLALGDNTPIFPWLYRNIPTFDMFQAPARYLIWAEFALVMLAGMAVMAWQRPQGRGLYWSRLGTMGAFAITLAAGIGYWVIQNGGFDLGEIKPTFIPAFAYLGSIGLGIGILNLLAPPSKDEKPKSLWQWSVAILLTLDLLIVGWGLNPAVDSSAYHRMAGSSASTLIEKPRYHLSLEDEQRLKFERFLTFESFEVNGGIGELRNALLPNTNILDDVSVTGNFDPILPERYVKWMSVLDKISPEFKSDMLARMGVDKVVTVSYLSPYTISLKETSENYGQVRWASCGISARDGDYALAMIWAGEVLGPENVLLEKEGPLICNEESHPEMIWNRMPNSVSIFIDAETDGYLVLADTWYPGWQAKVDGEITEIIHADYLFRAIEVPEGTHQIEFKYVPNSFYIGLTLSIIGWGLWIFFYRKQSEIK
ncbi:MAG: YfhO family protein [Chloroflexi bacterium]|jgi:hypothetical protein|nr:YfhO family protein [Chloroflexota bacterium]MBT3670427.1 YfhO family protein [Chloroflexota bacterium]MBT4304671.1 YfhO family protein [Chloroflexota bacterium]MBT4532573.1 YfhO family protein [Chloroflexota bacterium]MBT4681992.1 YfhO family protein [Chloroflexota bacterium]